jgi:hypothetical protein
LFVGLGGIAGARGEDFRLARIFGVAAVCFGAVVLTVLILLV